MDSIAGDVVHNVQLIKKISLMVLVCFILSIVGSMTIVTIRLLYRFLRLKLGSRVRPSAQKAVVITGATSGIGLALAKRFYRKRFTVFATYYNSEEPGYAELVTIEDNNIEADRDEPKLFLIHMDVRSESSIDTAAKEIERVASKLRLALYSVVCNAGVGSDCYFEINTLESMHKTIQTNLLGTVMVAKRFTPAIIKNKGRFVLVASATPYIIAPSLPIYTASKAAVRNLSDCLNESLKTYGASCRAIIPGNLMSRSNVSLTTVNCLQDSIAKLTREERTLYKKAIEENNQFTSKMVISRLHQMKQDPKRAAEAYGVSLPEAKCATRTTVTDWLVSFLDGGYVSSDGRDVDQLGALTAFDHAVLWRDPPRRCYCGNKTFQYITGPLFCEYTPAIMVPVLYYLFKNRMK